MATIDDSFFASQQLSVPENALLSFKFRYYDFAESPPSSFSIWNDREAYDALKVELLNNLQENILEDYPWTLQINQSLILVYTHEDGPTIHGKKEDATEIVSVAEEIRKWLEKWLRSIGGKPSAVVRLEVN